MGEISTEATASVDFVGLSGRVRSPSKLMGRFVLSQQSSGFMQVVSGRVLELPTRDVDFGHLKKEKEIDWKLQDQQESRRARVVCALGVQAASGHWETRSLELAILCPWVLPV